MEFFRSRARFSPAKASVLALVLLTGSSKQAVADFINNGDFSSNGGPGQVGIPSGTTGRTTLQNWTVFTGATNNSGSLGLIGTAAQFKSSISDSFGVNNFKFTSVTDSPTGGTFFAADGAPSYQTGIQQRLTGLTVGTSYQVTFDYAGAQQSGFTGPTTEQWKVYTGTSSTPSSGDLQFTTNLISMPSGTQFSGWKSASFDFTATSSTEFLSFLAAGTPDGEPPFSLLDGPSVNAAAVPEPSSIVMVGLGSVAVFVTGFLRRKNKENASA